MAEFRFYADWEDSWELLRIILEDKSLEYIPDIYYIRPKEERITDVAKYMKHAKVPSSGYVYGPFSEAKPILQKFQGPKPYRGKYRIDKIWGGQKIRYCPGGLWDLRKLGEGDYTSLGHGFVDYDQWFWKGKTEEAVVPTEQMKQYYKDIVKRMKKYLQKSKDSGRPIFVGPSGLRRLQSGEARIR